MQRTPPLQIYAEGFLWLVHFFSFPAYLCIFFLILFIRIWLTFRVTCALIILRQAFGRDLLALQHTHKSRIKWANFWGIDDTKKHADKVILMKIFSVLKGELWQHIWLSVYLHLVATIIILLWLCIVVNVIFIWWKLLLSKVKLNALTLLFNTNWVTINIRDTDIVRRQSVGRVFFSLDGPWELVEQGI